MKEKILNIETVHQCNCCLGCKTLHPLASAIDLSKASLEQQTIKFDFYTVLIIEGEVEEFLFGRKYYDYSNASLVFLMPGESIKIGKSKAFPTKGWLLAFHPDLLTQTSLGEHINNYSFFFYKIDEALHISQREKKKVIECLLSIEEELRHAIDCHSKTLISRYIELLLDYCTRFYERQFITRSEASKENCADILQLSPHYFNDLLKFESEKDIYEYYQLKRLDKAKKMLLNSDNTVSMITEKLGYPSVQYFSHWFKKLTGIVPNRYRLVQN